jgi:phospholipid/cholesterol/gamma-HCH transport system substrate-binding protein
VSRRSWRNGLVVLAVAALGAGAGAGILSQQRVFWPWQHTFTFSATFVETAGISPGNGQEVRIAGVPVGQITDAHVDGDGHAVVELRITGDHPIYQNARLVMRPKSPLNEIFVNVNPGGPPAPPLAEGAVLPLSASTSAIQIDEVLAHLDDDTRDALGALLAESDVALAAAPRDLPAALTGADGVLTDLQPVVAELNRRRETIAKLVGALSAVSTAVGGDEERLTSLSDSLNRTLHTVAGRDGQLDATLAALPKLSTSLREATGAVTDLAGELNPTLDRLSAASDTLPGALERTDTALSTLRDTVSVAKPALQHGRTVADDLRPFSHDLRPAARDLAQVSADLGPLTGQLVPYLPDLAAFVYNTNSMVSLHDANKGILRGQFSTGPHALPPLPLPVPTPISNPARGGR